MDLERAVISKALQAKDIRPLVEAGITEAFFPTQAHAVAWRWMLEYWQKYGKSPTVAAFRQNFPSGTYRLIKTEEPLPFLIDEMREQRKRSIIGSALFDMVERTNKFDVPADDLLGSIHEMLFEIGTDVSPLRDVDVFATWEERMTRYAELKNLPNGMRGIPYGFPSIDEATSGAQKQQLITFIGEPKAGKSTLLLRCALSARESGANVLVIGYEMSNDEQEARVDAMVGQVDHTKLLRGKLQEQSEERLRKRLRRAAKSKAKFILSQDVQSTTTVSGVIAKIQQYTPDIVFVDGAYLMDDELGEDKGTPRHLTNITRALKRAAQTCDVPIVITTQVLTWKYSRKKGLTGDSIGYSSSFAQDSDLILGVEHTDEDDVKTVRVVLSRSTARMMTKIRWNWARGDFEELEGATTYIGSRDEDEDEPGLGEIGF